MNASLDHAAEGAHWLIDCHDVDPGKLADPILLEGLLAGAATAAGARILFRHFHRFGDRAGVTGVVLLAESHITIHTWPEHGFAAIDLFLCGATAPERATAHIEAGLAPARFVTTRCVRGTELLSVP